MKTILSALALVFLTTQAHSAAFREYPAGDPIEINHLKIAGVYFPAVPMDHSTMLHSMGAGHAAMAMGDSLTEKDIAKEKFVKPGKELVHLEADIHATKENPNGFGAGEWIPYLQVTYELSDAATKKVLLEGELMPMVAKDGPHYGTTIRMPGIAKYTLKYKISAPGIARHSDKLTGVAEFWKPFEVKFDFDYEGLRK